ncbi:hypothetical protein BH23GEM9_BH23GEM9_35040 [soil metagenome]
MSEVLVEYQTVLRGRDDRAYAVRACGREREDGTWEGWLEFLPQDGTQPLVSGRETTQPNRADVLYWATGLTDPYLDGALLRLQTRTAPAVDAGEPAATAPARAPVRPHATHPAVAVLDPFHVYAEGADILRAQLHALSAGQLGNIIRAYGLSGDSAARVDTMTKPELIQLIVSAVEASVQGG